MNTKLTEKHRTRVRVRHFVNGHQIEAKWTVEVCWNRKWTPVGDDAGLRKFETREDAESERIKVVAALAS